MALSQRNYRVSKDRNQHGRARLSLHKSWASDFESSRYGRNTGACNVFSSLFRETRFEEIILGGGACAQEQCAHPRRRGTREKEEKMCWRSSLNAGYSLGRSSLTYRLKGAQKKWRRAVQA